MTTTAVANSNNNNNNNAAASASSSASSLGKGNHGYSDECAFTVSAGVLMVTKVYESYWGVFFVYCVVEHLGAIFTGGWLNGDYRVVKG